MTILHRLDDVVRLQRGEMVRPHFVSFITSNRCNHHCLGCAYAGKLDSEIMPEAEHFGIIDDLMEMGVKAYEFAGGGEPLALPYLPKLLRHIVDGDGYFSILTNGSLLTDELIELLVASGTYVRVSLEASNPVDYVAYKGVHASHWDRVLRNIRALVEEKRRTGSTLEIAARFSVGKSLHGERHYRDAMALAKELELDRFTVKALRHEPEELPEAERIEEQWTCDRVAEEMFVTGKCHSWIAPLPMERIPQCWLNPLHVIVDECGNCFICCFHYFRKERHYLGNMLEAPFAEFWFSEHHRKQIAGIRREECSRVDCKFAFHHEAVARFQERGMGYWL